MAPSIPRRIHFAWWQGISRVPTRFLLNARRWQALNPAWTVRLWDGARLAALARELDGGRWAQVMAAYRHDIQRLDFARLLVLWAEGGVYSDLDLLPLRPIAPLLSGRHFYICREHEPELSFCNAFIAAERRHPAIALMLEVLAACQPLQDRPHKSAEARVWATTGPPVVTRVVRRLRQQAAPGLAIDMDPNTVYPAPWSGAERVADLRAWAYRYPGSYAVHLWAGSWRDMPDLAAGGRP